ncbi:MAG: hypothetical protein M3Z66_08715 [Chloroflexota bacterium]|nr:hypothetical protein [Chloroflexota bacterium]
MAAPDLAGQLTDWIVGQMTVDAEPSPVRDYYLILLRRGHGVPEAVGLAVEDLLEEVRSAVAQGEAYNQRAHRARLGLPSNVPVTAHRLPRPALVRRIALERANGQGPRPVRRPQRESET